MLSRCEGCTRSRPTIADGNVILDESGSAIVELPSHFEALNREFRYQLTAIGAPDPNLYAADKVSGNQFSDSQLSSLPLRTDATYLYLAGMKSDILTIAAIATVAYVVQNVLHEGLGHGGACVLTGGDPIALSTAYFDCGAESLTSGANKFIAAAGAIVNVIVGLGLWALLARTTIRNDSLRFFVWLSMAINLFTGTGYLLFSGALGVGDWVVVVEGLQPVWLWKLILIVSGSLLYLLCVWISLIEMNRFIGNDADRMARATRHAVIPYVVGSTVSTIGAALNPISPLLLLTSAASSFGGTSAMAWMTQLLRTDRFKPEAGESIALPRSWPWIITAALVLLFHVLVLGPSIEF